MAVIYLNVPDELGKDAIELATNIELLLAKRSDLRGRLKVATEKVEREYMELGKFTTESPVLVGKMQVVLAELYTSLRTLYNES